MIGGDDGVVWVGYHDGCGLELRVYLVLRIEKVIWTSLDCCAVVRSLTPRWIKNGTSLRHHRLGIARRTNASVRPTHVSQLPTVAHLLPQIASESHVPARLFS